MAVEYWTAKQSAEFLGITPASLYAYVSRKGIRSMPVSGSREHRYLRTDIESLRKRKRSSHRSEEGVVLKSGVTLLTVDGPYYRGQLATELAETASFETVAALLWAVDESIFGDEPPIGIGIAADLNKHLIGADTVHRALALFPFLEDANPRAFDLSHQGMALTGSQILRWLTAIVLRQRQPRSDPIHQQFGDVLKLGQDFTELVRRLLVLAADHGLEEATHAVRVVASTGVTPWRAAATGISVITGRASKSGRTDAVRRLLKEILASNDPIQPIVERIKGNEDIPGFGIPVYYPKGDPRARSLFNYCDQALSDDRDYKHLKRALQAAERFKGLQPHFALATLFADVKFRRASKAKAHNWDPAATPFLVGRCAGWIAHAIEQYALGEIGRRPVDYRGLLPAPV